MTDAGRAGGDRVDHGVRIGFLGPEGTFTHETALMAAERLGLHQPLFVPYPTGDQAVEAAAHGDVDFAVVAVATSLSGAYSATQQLIETRGVHQIDEIQRVCHYHLLAPAGATIAGLRTISSVPKALADCTARLDAIVPGLPRLTTSSTAEAVRRVAEAGDATQAAVGTAAAARRYGLATLAENIEDDADNWTRWVVVRADGKR